MPKSSLILLLLVGSSLAPATAQDQPAATPQPLDPESQISHAVLALPEAMRDSSAVFGYTGEMELVELRPGTNGMICVADKPGDDRYSSVCYHESLDPFMARGRELRAEGVEGKDVLAMRHEEMDAGTLALPKEGAALYNVTMKLEEFDPETATPVLYAIYTPYATSESTGLPEQPPGPGAPWIMRGGSASSHIMIIAPVDKDE